MADIGPITGALRGHTTGGTTAQGGVVPVTLATGYIDSSFLSGGAGTVTSVSVVTANGVSGTVATATTTPAITLTLGAITPTTVNGMTITTSSGTFTLANSKVFTVSNTLTLTATDGSTLAIGTGGTLGTAAYTAASAYQAADAELTAIAGLTSAANKIIVFSGSGTAATADYTPAGFSLTLSANATVGGTHSGTSSGTNTGDQTSVSGNAGTVTVADAGGDTTTWVLLGTAQTGSLAPATDAGLTYNATTDALTATTFVGALTGNASTATAWATGRTVSITGDLAYTSGSLDGSGNVTGTGTLANTAVSAGSYTNANITVDAKGRLTAAANGTGGGSSSVLGISGPWGMRSGGSSETVPHRPPGANGGGVLNRLIGSGAPATGTALGGEFYVDNTNTRAYFGKIFGSTWYRLRSFFDRDIGQYYNVGGVVASDPDLETGDNAYIATVEVDSTGGAIQITLPSSGDFPGRKILVIDCAGTAATNNITITAGTITGDTTINTAFGYREYVATETAGAGWVLINRN